ncbi:MAG: hypothetical protein ACTSRU_00905, partial [Candidatus Hodarchaeales archaeon]
MKKKSLGFLFGVILLISIMNLINTSAMMVQQDETLGKDNNNQASPEAIDTISNPIVMPEEATDDLNTVNRQPGPERTSQESNPIRTPDTFEPGWNSPAGVSNPLPGTEKLIFVWLVQPYDVYVGQIFDILIIVENLEPTAVNTNVSLEIDGFVVYHEENVSISAGMTFEVYVSIQANVTGYHYVEAIVENYGDFYFGDCYYVTHAVDQVLILIYQPEIVPTGRTFEVMVRVWNLLSSNVSVSNVELRVNGSLMYTYPGPYDLSNVSADSFFDVFFNVTVTEEGTYQSTVNIDTTVGPYSWSELFDAWTEYYYDDYGVFIEQFPEYEVDEPFTIGVWIESYADISREVNLYVDITYEDGTIDILYNSTVFVDGNRLVILEFTLLYSKTGMYDVYASIDFIDEYGIVEMYDSFCYFNIIDFIPDYTIWINQQFMYPVNENFSIYLEVTSKVDFGQDVYVFAEINATVVYSDFVWIDAYDSISIELELNYSLVGYYEITATVDDGAGFLYSDSYCYFWVSDFSSGYVIYIDQKDWYRASEEFLIILHIASYTDVDRYVNITLELNGMIYYSEMNRWMTNESYEEIWIYLTLDVIGGYNVYAWIEDDIVVFAEDWCYFDLIEPNWFDLWIEQDWGYTINTWFTVWVWINSHEDFDRELQLTVEITFSDGHTEIVWSDFVNAVSHSETGVPIDLYFDKFGHYDIHAYIEYFVNEDYYYDAWCGFEIVDYIPEFYIWIEQDFIYSVNEAFSIYVIIESNIDITRNVTLTVYINNSIEYYENVTVEAYGSINVQVSLNLTETGFYGVHAWIDDAYERYFIAEAFCGFWIEEYYDYYVFIEQKDSYEINTDFYITVWIKSNVPTSVQFNLTVVVGGTVYYYEENIWVDAYAVLSFDVWLNLAEIGGYDVYASIDIDGTVIAMETCYFEMVEMKWLEVHIYQEPFYYIYDEFSISVGVKASYETDVNVTLYINDDEVMFWQNIHLTAHYEEILDISLNYDYTGNFHVRALVEEFDEFSGSYLWWEGYCNFDINDREDYNIEIWQEWFYFDNDTFTITVAIWSTLDYFDNPYLEVWIINMETNITFYFEDWPGMDPHSFYMYNITFSELDVGFYSVHAMLHSGDKIYEQFCHFDIVQWAPFYVFIEQMAWYTVDEDFTITIWLYNNLDYDLWVNLTVLITTPNGYVDEVFFGTFNLIAGEVMPVPIYL